MKGPVTSFPRLDGDEEVPGALEVRGRCSSLTGPPMLVHLAVTVTLSMTLTSESLRPDVSQGRHPCQRGAPRHLPKHA